jgi:predicted membrane channel-forming protein YqfA (hemolysin III family)
MATQAIRMMGYAAITTAASTLPAFAAGDDMEGLPRYAIIFMAIVLPSLLIGYLLGSFVKGQTLTLLLSSMIIIGWFALIYFRGVSGALDRTAVFLEIVLIPTLPLLGGWFFARNIARAASNSAVGNGH